MPRLDKIHEPVKQALIRDGWTITHDPYVIRYEKVRLFADLGAEFPLAAEQGNRKILVEVKSFLGASVLQDLKETLGQYDIYTELIPLVDPERRVYIAVSSNAYQSLCQQDVARLVLERRQVALLVVDIEKQRIEKWIY